MKLGARVCEIRSSWSFRTHKDHALDFPVSEQIADVTQLLGTAQRDIVIRIVVIAVGAVEGINIPERRVIPRRYYFEARS